MFVFGFRQKNVDKAETKKFSTARFLSGTFICSALHTSLISCVLIPYTKSIGMLPLQISVIITIKRLIRLVGDTFFGLVFDRFGAKILFVIGRLMKLFCYFALLKYQNFYAICIVMVIYGLSEGTIQGKVSSFIYNNLKANNKISFFSRAISLYYLVIDVHLALMNFFAGVLIKFYGYDIIIKISIAMNIVSLFMIFVMIPSAKNTYLQQFSSKSFKEVLNTIIAVVKNNHLVAYLIAIYGVLVFFVWQFGSIASMVLLDMGFNGSQVAMMGSVVKICVVAGTVVSFFFFKDALSMRRTADVILFIILFGAIGAVFYNVYLFCIFMMLIDACYVVLEISLEKNLENMSNKKVRGTAISLAMTCCNAVAVFANLFVGFVAQYLNYRISLTSVMVAVLVITLILWRKFQSCDD